MASFVVTKIEEPSMYGTVYTVWTLSIPGIEKSVFEYLHNPSSNPREMDSGPLDAPWWHHSCHVQDWRDYVDSSIEKNWDQLDDVVRMVYIMMWDAEASKEDWD